MCELESIRGWPCPSTQNKAQPSQCQRGGSEGFKGGCILDCDVLMDKRVQRWCDVVTPRVKRLMKLYVGKRNKQNKGSVTDKTMATNSLSLAPRPRGSQGR